MATEYIQLLWISQLLGRLHPMVIHFPIVLIFLIGFFELFRPAAQNAETDRIVGMMVNLALFSAIISVVFGFQLMNNEGYSGDLMDLHFYTGVGTSILIFVLALLRLFNARPKIFKGFVILSLVAVTITGHLGASITHGEDYLSGAFKTQALDDRSGEIGSLIQEVNAGNHPDSTLLERLSTEVKGIIAHNCYQCHNENKVKGGLVLDSKQGLLMGGESGPVIIPGDPAQSELYRRILLDKNDDEVMPKKGKKLPQDEIQLIRKWIELGAYYNDQAVQIFPEAVLSLNRPPIPENDDFSNPIDRFVSAYFEGSGSDFPEVVDDRVFIRRVYLDVIGLLPTPEVVESFIARNQPDKRTDLVDSLLDDRYNFSAHWLSFWNDLLRNDYSGTGFITGGRRQITNWLYESIYANKSYDSMVVQLINPTPESEGFIQGIKWRGSVNSSQTTDMQAAQNIGQSLLGVNVKCASCHNSFVSNLKLDQVYAFANIFSDTTLEIHRCDKPLGKMAGTAFIYPELGEISGSSLAERLESLSEVMVSRDNGRLYRTLVNRIWGRLMGRGIVYRYDEMDDPPWSQDLLDYLAADFRDNETDINRLIRLIVTSRAYQLPSISYHSEDLLSSANYQFEGPVYKRLTSEQFTDAISQIIHPLYASLNFNPFGIDNRATWIWKPEIEFDRAVLPKPGKVFFRKSFWLESEREGSFMITADDQFKLYINGQLVGQGDHWETVSRGEISFQKGENIIAISAENLGTIPKPAGLLFLLSLPVSSDSSLYISSDRSWVCTDQESENWKEISYDDSDWESVAIQNRKHWGLLPAFDFENQWDKPFIRSSFVALDPLMKALGRPTREIVITKRIADPTLLQALNLSNNEFLYQKLIEGAVAFSELPDQEAVDQLYLTLLGRRPDKREKNLILEHLDDPNRKEFFADLMWSIVLLPEFQFIQ